MATALTPILFAELFQTEHRALRHTEREAERLGAIAPGAAMRAVSRHAAEMIPLLEQLARARGLGRPSVGQVIGFALSSVRDHAIDLVVSREKSYRSALTDVRHGVDLVLLLQGSAIAENDEELADFCTLWLAERRQLAEAVERELAWFAAHPGAAQSRARFPLVEPHAQLRPQEA